MRADIDARPHVKCSLLPSVRELFHDTLSVCTLQRPLLLRMVVDEFEGIQKEQGLHSGTLLERLRKPRKASRCLVFHSGIERSTCSVQVCGVATAQSWSVLLSEFRSNWHSRHCAKTFIRNFMKTCSTDLVIADGAQILLYVTQCSLI
jgi:hypothetical protein